MPAFSINAMLGVFVCICVVYCGAFTCTCVDVYVYACFYSCSIDFVKFHVCFSLTFYVCEMFFNASSNCSRSFNDPIGLGLHHNHFTLWHIHFVFLLLISSLDSVCYFLYGRPTFPSVKSYVQQNNLQV